MPKFVSDFTPEKINDIVNDVISGESMSMVAKKHDVSLTTVSKYCKMRGIKSSKETVDKNLPVETIRDEYINGTSWYKLSKKYNISAHNLKNKMLRIYPDIDNRDMDQAKRPDILNDRIELSKALQNQSVRSLSKSLKVKIATVSAAVKRLGVEYTNKITAPKITDEELIYYYVQERKSIQWLLDKFGMTRPNLLIRMDKLDIREGMRDYKSDNPLLADPTEIFELYDSGWSMAQLAVHCNCSIGSVAHCFKHNNKKQRSIVETYRKLRYGNAKYHKVETKNGPINLQSDQELLFFNSIDKGKDLFYERDTFHFRNRIYTPDFCLDGQYVEIKPKMRSCLPGPERSDFIKQKLIAEHNNINLKVWYDGSYYEYPDVNDDDIYFAVDWKLFFENDDELFQWLLKCGFKPLKWRKQKLWHAVHKPVPTEHSLNANYQNEGMVNFIRHFADHYWYSSRKDYRPVSAAFEIGNSVVLKEAIKMIWEKRDTNIYSLVRCINQNFKDFMMPSIFKPWIANHVYNKYLSKDDVVYDPCIGWGGRLIGTLETNITYIGSDLNVNSVDVASSVQKYLRNYLHSDNKFFQADASTVTRDQLPESVDAIFTSPPYDDTEHYHGLEKQCSDTSQIYKNLFGLGIRKVIFNIPWRHSDNVKKIATDCGYKLFDTVEMKTSAPIRRSKMSEPIHVFLK